MKTTHFLGLEIIINWLQILKIVLLQFCRIMVMVLSLLELFIVVPYEVLAITEHFALR